MSPLRSMLIGALRRVARRRWLVTFEMALPPAGGLDPAPPSGVTIRRATLGDAAALAPLILGHEPVEFRFKRGDVALVAELDGRLVGCQWIAAAPMRLGYYQVTVVPSSHERYCYGLHVLPEARRRGVATALERALLPEAWRTGTTIYFCHVDGRNRASLAAHAAMGWSPREASFGFVLLDRFGVTLWRRRPEAEGR